MMLPIDAAALMRERAIYYADDIAAAMLLSARYADIRAQDIISGDAMPCAADYALLRALLDMLMAISSLLMLLPLSLMRRCCCR